MELTLVGQNPFRAPEFKRLFEEWNKRLKESGFDDAEDFSLPEPALKSWHSLKWENEQAQRREVAASAYYDLANELLHNGFGFSTDLERRIWELHCSGLSIRKIQVALWSQMLRYRGLQRKNIHEIILMIQKKSGIKNG